MKLLPETETASSSAANLARAPGCGWPVWVPVAAAHYLRHVEQGLSLRQLAQQSGCHPSTVLRQVRKLENRRDDPLVDSALRLLGRSATAKAPVIPKGDDMAADTRYDPLPTDDATLDREARRILRRLTETGAVLAVVPDMEKAVVVRDTASGTTRRTAVVDTCVAQAMALKEWIVCKTPGRIARYHVTAAGRAELTRLLAQEESGQTTGHWRGGVERTANPSFRMSLSRPGNACARISNWRRWRRARPRPGIVF